MSEIFHPTETIEKASFDFSQDIPDYNLFGGSKEKQEERKNLHERRKQTMKEWLEKDVMPLIEQNSQIEEGKLNYAITGSYVYLLTAVADKTKVFQVKEDGTLGESSEEIVANEDTVKTMAIKPGDVDVIKYKDTHFVGAVADNFEDSYFGTPRVVGYEVGGKKIIGTHPLDQFIGTWLGYSGNYGPVRMLGNISKAQDKISRFEFVLKSLLQTYPLEQIAEEIAQKYQSIPHKNVGLWLLENPEKMRDYLENKGSDYEYTMDKEKYPALLMLMKQVALAVKKE